MSIRDTIAQMAIWEADSSSGWRPSGDEMVQFFQMSGLAPPNAADLKKLQTMQSNVRVNGQSISWCGIFACYVLKAWGKLDVHWVSGTGIVGEGVQKKVWDWRYMRRGDVAVIKNASFEKDGHTLYMHHHYIVTDIDYDANTHSFVEGNGKNNKIWWHENRPITHASGVKNNLKRPYCYYQIKA